MVVERTGLDSLCSGALMCYLPLHITPAQGKYSRALFLASDLQEAMTSIETELLGHKAGKPRERSTCSSSLTGTGTKENKRQSPAVA